MKRFEMVFGRQQSTMNILILFFSNLILLVFHAFNIQFRYSNFNVCKYILNFSISNRFERMLMLSVAIWRIFFLRNNKFSQWKGFDTKRIIIYTIRCISFHQQFMDDGHVNEKCRYLVNFEYIIFFFGLCSVCIWHHFNPNRVLFFSRSCYAISML